MENLETISYLEMNSEAKAKARIIDGKDIPPQIKGASRYYFPNKHTPKTVGSFFAKFYAMKKFYDVPLFAIKEIEEIYFSPVVRYGNASAIKDNTTLVSVDISTAYGNHMLNKKLPGFLRTVTQGFLSCKKDSINVYTIAFHEEFPSEMLKIWFFSNESIMTMRGARKTRIFPAGQFGFRGQINIIATVKNNELFKLFMKLCKSARVIFTTICEGEEKVYINRENLEHDIAMKVQNSSLKRQITTATGYLLHLDKISYFHMTQSIKERVLSELVGKLPLESIVAMNTDGIIVAFENSDKWERYSQIDEFINQLKNTDDLHIDVDVKVRHFGSQVFADKGGENT